MQRWNRREIALFVLPILAGIGVLLSLAAKNSALFSPRQSTHSAGCQAALGQLSTALALYAQDYDGLWPPASNSWARLLVDREMNFSMIQCVSEKTPPAITPAARGYVDYWLNGNLAGQPKSVVTVPQSTLMLGDGNDGTDKTDSTYSISAFPPSWLTNSTMPPSRHLGGANYVFVDGHVKWLRPDEVAHFGGRKDPFALN